MKTEFTKGPWVAVSNGAYFYIKPKNENENSLISIYPDVCIGVMHSDEANAHLIAAAPEMYEMLSLISRNYSEDLDRPLMISDIETLLAKARGEQVNI